MKMWDNYDKKKKEDDPEFYDERLEEYKKQEWDRRLNGVWIYLIEDEKTGIKKPFFLTVSTSLVDST